MNTNTSFCNVFANVINAAFDVTRGADVADVIGELIMLIRDKVTPEEFSAIQTALMNIDECQVHRPEEGVRIIDGHSVIGVTPEGRRMITPTSEEAFDRLIEMGFESHVEDVVYDATRTVPTIMQHHVVVVKTVFPGPDSIEC